MTTHDNHNGIDRDIVAIFAYKYPHFWNNFRWILEGIDLKKIKGLSSTTRTIGKHIIAIASESGSCGLEREDVKVKTLNCNEVISDYAIASTIYCLIIKSGHDEIIHNECGKYDDFVVELATAKIKQEQLTESINFNIKTGWHFASLEELRDHRRALIYLGLGYIFSVALAWSAICLWWFSS